MVHVSFWFVLMLIYWEETYIVYRKTQKLLVVASKETGVEVNADKTKSRDQNARRSHSIKIDNCFFERVEEFRYLGTALTNQNSVQEEIKG